jgi:hypothetical protein
VSVRTPGHPKVIVVIASSTNGFTAHQADAPRRSTQAGNHPKLKVKKGSLYTDVFA